MSTTAKPDAGTVPLVKSAEVLAGACMPMVRVYTGRRFGVSDIECQSQDQASAIAKVLTEAHMPVRIDGGKEKAKPKRLRYCRGFVETINEFCSCGGGGPDNGCTACKIFHAIADWEVTGS